MIIIGFSDKTSKVLPRIFCGKWKHVAPIIPNGLEWIMYQFVRRGHIVAIPLKTRDIKILRAHGWKFLYMYDMSIPCDFNAHDAWTCVQLAKRAIGIHKWWIQTPTSLHRIVCYYCDK